ncbi:MAG TPA: FecR domain-containing protein [Polyangiaceae bacterium]
MSHDALGARLAKSLGVGPGKMSVVAQEARIAEAARLGYAERRRRLPLAWAAVSVLVASVVIALVIRPVAVTSSSATPASAALSAAKIKRQLEAKSRTALVALEDGSALSLAAHTRASIDEGEGKNTTVSLAGGRIDVHVKPRQAGEFRVEAGRYRVRVVGTRFSVTYAASAQHIRVEVTQGRVRVEGPELPEDGLLVDAGGHFSNEVSSASSTAHTVVDPPEEASRSELPAVASAAPRAEAGEADAHDWQAFAEQGEYRRALEVAEAMGFDGLVRTLGEAPLLQLANSARFSGNNPRAKQAFLGVRRRFPSSPSAILSGYYLARLALDVEHNRLQAVEWLQTYLREAPRGQLSAGARLDLMKLFLETGDTASARRIAADYLKHHPNGNRADFAKSLLQRTAPEP